MTLYLLFMFALPLIDWYHGSGYRIRVFGNIQLRVYRHSPGYPEYGELETVRRAEWWFGSPFFHEYSGLD